MWDSGTWRTPLLAVGGVDKAKFHYTGPTRTRHGPDRTRTDFFAAKLRWVRAGPVGSVQWNLARTRQRARTLSVSGPCRVRVVEFSY